MCMVVPFWCPVDDRLCFRCRQAVLSFREGLGVIMAGMSCFAGFFYGSLQMIRLIHFDGRGAVLSGGYGDDAS